MAMQKMLQSFALSRFRRRADKYGKPISFSALLHEAQRVLVCLPEIPAEYDRIAASLAGLRKNFPKAHVTLLQNGAIPVATEMARGFQLIVWGPTDMDRSGGPNAACKKRLFSTPFDVVIDLNLSVRYFSLAVVMESGAPIRAGYAESAREELYTFLYRPGTPDAIRALEGLLVYLGRPEPARSASLAF
ncbi:MAG TPA: hypothetical protein PKI62_07990 [bacterium]|nr:hypothetical protein [bacterium]HPR88217.1 hypothetical protein [bacterium]